jgi:hypothetical protein
MEKQAGLPFIWADFAAFSAYIFPETRHAEPHPEIFNADP